MKITLGRTVHGPFTISVSITTSRVIGACIYQNQRPIFTSFFFIPITRTLKTEEGESLKFRGGGGGGGEIPNGGRDPYGSRPGEG